LWRDVSIHAEASNRPVHNTGRSSGPYKLKTLILINPAGSLTKCVKKEELIIIPGQLENWPLNGNICH